MITLIISTVGALLIAICIFLSLAMIKAITPAKKPVQHITVNIARIMPEQFNVTQLQAEAQKAVHESLVNAMREAEMQVKY